MAGLATVFGSGAMTNSIPEIENNDVIFVIGSNTTETHPIIGLRMKKAVRKGAKIIVADPRKINLVRFATVWMQHKPGTDVALLNGIMHVLLKEKLTDRHFINEWTEGFEEFKKKIEEWTPEKAEKITGVPKKAIVEAALLYGRAERPGIYYTMGITQHSHGTQNVFFRCEPCVDDREPGQGKHWGQSPERSKQCSGRDRYGLHPQPVPGIPEGRYAGYQGKVRSCLGGKALRQTRDLPLPR